ncbi:MAG TPA: VIT and VWA domain-containing protein, partial [Planctomycetaceae bacterium]|nr:VIT and VWA domain-containing protein [Planctomycetaceae bacterium]
MSSIRRTLVILTAAIPLVLAASAQACFMRAPLPVQVWMDHINVDIVNDVASKTYDCVFKNPNAQAVIGGECYMELEPGPFVEKMTVTVDGKTMEAEILDVKKANEVFQDIVRRGGSPALLEYYGNQLIRTKVPRINPGGTVRVKLTYTTVLKPQNGLVRLQMLNTNPKTLMQKLTSAGVTINFKSDRPIQNIYSPTHPIKVVEKPEWDISVEWSEKDYLPKQPFVLYFQSSPQEVGASLIAHRERGQDGHFMLMLSPSQGKDADKFKPLEKDVVFCVDTSGSMIEANKMEQARAALKYCLEQLRTGDRFNIVEFSTETRSFRDKPVKLNDENLKAALEYTANLHPRGGTAIHEALKKSLDQLTSKDRLKMIVFATDGLPTIGERDPKNILKDVEQWNRHDVRIFCFGEGIDVNTKLLDGLSLEQRGQSDYILPEEDISKIISRFFDRVGTPVMSDISIKIDGLMVRDVQPTTVSDLFQGEQIAVFGQYSGSGKKNVTIEGFWNGEKRKLTFEVEFPERSDSEKHSFVPRLWAGQQVDFLLREIRKQDKPEQELVDEVVRLAKRYGIVTPYTTFLMGEDLF